MSDAITNIIKSFAALDINSLAAQLNKDARYDDTTYEVFIARLEEIFASHLNSGDTHLEVYGGQCGGTHCPNCGIPGYRFVGNHSRIYFDLLFETEGERLKDISSCNQFITKEEAPSLQMRVKIDIDQNKRISFNATSDIQARLDAAIAAFDEVVTTPPRMMTFDALTEWIEKHSTTLDQADSFDFIESPMKWTAFQMLYVDLQEIAGFIQLNHEEVTRAISTITDPSDEERLIQWLTTHEEIGNEAPWLLKYTFTKREDYFRWNDKNPIYFTGEVFRNVIYFLEYYDQYYTQMFEKYATVSDQEISFLYTIGTEEDKKNLYSLRYHLEKRKKLEAEGAAPPLHINHYGIEEEGTGE